MLRTAPRLAVLLTAPAAPLAVMLGVIFPAAASAGTRSHQGATSTPGCRTGGAALWGDLAACGWPGSTNTGGRCGVRFDRPAWSPYHAGPTDG